MFILPDFFIIPCQLYSDPNLRPMDERIFGLIHWLTKQKLEKCTMSNQTIAELLRLQKSTVANGISRLHKLGYIKVEINPLTRARKGIISLMSFQKEAASTLVDTPSTYVEAPYSHEYAPSTYVEQNKRIKKDNIKRTPSLRFAEISDITEAVMEEIANRYQVPTSFVRSKLDDLTNYCEAKGKSYRNYKAALCNWVKQDAFKVKQGGGEQYGQKTSRIAVC